MDIRLIYFSQAGNSRKVAKAMAEVFSSEGHSAQATSYRKANHTDFIGADLIYESYTNAGSGKSVFLPRRKEEK